MSSGALPLTGFNLPSVPSMALETQGFVEGLLTDSRERASEAVTAATNALQALRDAKLVVTLPDPPSPPTITTEFGGGISLGFDVEPEFGSVETRDPPVFLPEPPITLPNLTSLIPDYVPIITGYALPNAPTALVVTMPTPPALNTDITVPDAPLPDYGDIPDLESIVIPTFTAPTIETFAIAAPSFDATVPSPTVEWDEPEYNAWIADTLRSTLNLLLAGGTGIDPVVERQIWDRDRARLEAVAQGRLAEADTTFADARQYPMRPGALLAAIRSIMRDNQQEVSKASRDVAIKQADLEQTNRQFAVKSGIELEQIFVQIFLATTQRNFDIAKYAVEARISIFNAEAAAYNTEARVYELQIAQWKSNLEYALAQIQIYKAQIEAEQLKGEVNKELIEAFRAKVQAFTAQADAYRSLVQAASARADMEKNKVELFRAQIEGVQAQYAAKKSEFDGYVARIQGESSKADLEKANAQAYSARVGAITAGAEITVKQAEMEMQHNKLTLDFNIAELQRLGQLAGQQLQAIQARTAIFDTLTRRGTAKFESDKSTKALEIQSQMEAAKVLVAYYGTQIEVWKGQVTALLTAKEITSKQLESAAQVAATMAAGSLAGSSVSAAFNGSVGRSETSGQSETYTSGTSTTDSTQNSTSFIHNFQDS